jgi:hypothetical protein
MFYLTCNKIVKELFRVNSLILYLVSTPCESGVKADGLAVGSVFRLQRMGTQAHPSPQGPLCSERASPGKADSLGPCCCPGSQPKRRQGDETLSKTQGWARLLNQLPPVALAQSGPQTGHRAEVSGNVTGLATGACPEKGAKNRAGGGNTG